MLCRALEKSGGVQVVTAYNGKQLIETVINQKQEFDIALVDEVMPTMTGTEAATKVRPGHRV